MEHLADTVQAHLAGINQQVWTFISASTPSWGASHSPVLVACACFSLSRRLIFLHFLEKTASVSAWKQSARTRDVRFSTSPVSAVLGVLALRRGFLSPWEGCLTLLEWTSLAQLLLPELWSQLLPWPPRPAFLYISLPSFQL